MITCMGCNTPITEDNYHSQWTLMCDTCASNHEQRRKKGHRLARTSNLDGSNPQVFELPGPEVISHIKANPDGTFTAELTEYGRTLLRKD